MRHLFVLFFFFLLYYNVTEAQTYANIPGPENVLVVYKVPTSFQDTLGRISDSVKTYYVNARGIPAVNVVGLTLPDSVEITVDNVTHWVGIRQVTDNIRDINNHNSGTWFATEHAWKYFYQYVAVTIKNHQVPVTFW